MINHLRVLLPHNKVVLHFGEQTIIFIKRQERKYQELNRKYHDMKAANHMLEVSIDTYLYNWTIISINKKYSVIRASWKIKLINGIWLSFFFFQIHLLVGLKFKPRFFGFFFTILFSDMLSKILAIFLIVLKPALKNRILWKRLETCGKQL